LKDKDGTVRIASAAALMKIDPEKHAAPTIQTLTAELRSSDILCRILAADALGDMGSAARSALAPLDEASKDADPDVSAAASKALKRIAGR
jgi:HEAT repeat protein